MEEQKQIEAQMWADMVKDTRYVQYRKYLTALIDSLDKDLDGLALGQKEGGWQAVQVVAKVRRVLRVLRDAPEEAEKALKEEASRKEINDPTQQG